MNDMHDAIRAETVMASRPPGIANLAKALAAAQAEFKPVPKDRTVKVKTQAGSYDFSYSTLDAILDMALPVLAKHDLALTHTMQPQERGPLLLVAKLLHGGTGEVLESVYPLVVAGSGPQAVGSAITYGRRYTASALLCICADDDDDGNAAAGNHVEAKQDRPRQGAKPQQQAQQTRSAPRQEARSRDGAGPAWKEMAWPLCKQGGGYEDMRDPDAWHDTIGRWVANIQQSASLPPDMKPQMIASLREKLGAILDHLEDRGDKAAVGEVRFMLRKALGEEEE